MPTTRSASARARRAAAAAGPPPASQPRPDEAAAEELTLLALPSELLPEPLHHLATLDLSSVDQLCHAFHSAAPGAQSVVEQALRLRAAAAGHAVPEALGREGSWVQLLLWEERRRWRGGRGPRRSGSWAWSSFIYMSLWGCCFKYKM